MALRVSPRAWPLLALSSPILLPKLIRRNAQFKRNRELVEQMNRQRLEAAGPIELPELETLELTVLVEQRAAVGFRTDPAVAYLVATDCGRLLFDVGFGPDSPTLGHNAERLGIDFATVDAVAISHLHMDHMGGMAAFRAGEVRLPRELGQLQGKPCFLPAAADSAQLHTEVVETPRQLTAGIGTTGPLARSLFFLGLCQEQALLARVKDKGIVVLTGCGHPTLELILQMVRRLTNDPLHAIVGGLHFPVTESRSQRRGVQVQMFFGTGKPPWRRIGDTDLSRTIEQINAARPAKVALSAHDTCDHALGRLAAELHCETEVLQAGETYSF